MEGSFDDVGEVSSVSAPVEFEILLKDDKSRGAPKPLEAAETNDSWEFGTPSRRVVVVMVDECWGLMASGRRVGRAGLMLNSAGFITPCRGLAVSSGGTTWGEIACIRGPVAKENRG